MHEQRNMDKILQAYGLKDSQDSPSSITPYNDSAKAFKRTQELVQISDGTHANSSSTQKALFRWGTTYDCIINFDTINALPLLCNRTAEHIVYFDSLYDKAIKLVKPFDFGLGFNWKKADLCLGKGSFKFYVERQMLFNLAFGGTYRFEGITIIQDEILEKDIVNLVLSQNWVWPQDIFNPNPSSTQVTHYMNSLGFRPGQRTNQWCRDEDNLYIADTREDNYVLATCGVIPIDIIVGFKNA